MITYLDMDSGTTYVEAPDEVASHPAPQQEFIEDSAISVAPRLQTWADQRVTAPTRPSIALIEACLARLDADKD